MTNCFIRRGLDMIGTRGLRSGRRFARQGQPRLEVPLMTAKPLRSKYASEERWLTNLLGNAISRDSRMRLL